MARTIFLNYRRDDTVWPTRLLYEFLVKSIPSERLFMDVAGIKGGDVFPEVLMEQVVACETMLVVIGPQWLTLLDKDGRRRIDSSKDYVHIEIASALKLNKKMIPVLVDGAYIPREDDLPEPLKALALRDAMPLRRDSFEIDGQAIVKRLLRRAETQLHVGTVEDLKPWGWDGIKLLQELIRLDYETTENLTHINEGSPEQWSPIFMNSPSSWRMLTARPKQIVGYWHLVSLCDDDWKALKLGELPDSEITADRVNILEFPGEHNVYILQACMQPEYRKPPKNVQQLFETFFEVLELLAADDIFIKEVAANALSEIGPALCRTFKMTPLGLQKHGGTIYVGRIEDIFKVNLAKKFPKLLKYYADYS